MMRERMSRPSSSLPNQCAAEGGSRRVGRLIEAGSCGAIQGAKIANSTKIDTNTTPVAARGLWRAARRNEMAAVDIRTKSQKTPRNLYPLSSRTAAKVVSTSAGEFNKPGDKRA